MEILNKKKQGFPSDMLSWIQDDKMQSIINDTINNPNSFSSSYLNANLVKNILSEIDVQEQYLLFS